MSQYGAWKELVARSFRQKYTFPVEAQHNWFPGHMHKGLGQIQRRMADIDCVLEVHDARIPLSGRNLTFRENLNKSRPHILILNKHDLFPEEEKEKVRKALISDSLVDVVWTNCKERDDPGLTSLIPTVANILKDKGRQSEGEFRPYNTVLVVGIPNTGKSTLINKLRGYHLRVGGRPAPVAAKPGWTKAVGEKIRVCDEPCVYLLDSPGISVPHITNMEAGMKLAACGTLRDHLVGEQHICDFLLHWLNTHHYFQYVDLMGLDQPEDDGTIMLAKAAISNKKFKRVRDVSQSLVFKTVPDLLAMANKFLKLFRGGHFGPINLDTDLFSGDGLGLNSLVDVGMKNSKKANVY